MGYDGRGMSMEYDVRGMSMGYDGRGMSMGFDVRGMSMGFDVRGMSMWEGKAAPTSGLVLPMISEDGVYQGPDTSRGFGSRLLRGTKPNSCFLGPSQ